MKTQSLHTRIRNYLGNARRYIQRGNSRNSASFNARTPVIFIEGNAMPVLMGEPYLKTGFRNGRFHKILYTPSTLKVVVGKQW